MSVPFLSLSNSIERGFDTFFEWLPSLIGALVILLIGYILAKIVGRLLARVHGEGQQGRHLVHHLRPEGLPAGVNRGRGGRDAIVLGAWLQPGRVVHHPHRSDADRY